MNSLDIIIIAIIGLVAFRGYHRGLIKEAVSLTSVFIGLFVASHLHGVFVPHLKVYIANQGTVLALSYLITFIGTLVGLWFLVRFLQDVLKVAMLTVVDKAAGAAFGAVEGLLLGLVLLLLLKAVLPGTSVVRQSVFAQKTDPALVLLANFTPEPIRETLEEGGFALPKPAPPPIPSRKPILRDQKKNAKDKHTI
ncbi:membrane protein required for colicin V production [Humidesulfovibrio mexicanus]|uniref:Membrane protein required for colicin V production n=1 Tax=Humidesulfovibrio mexicanus TaxID=147047 RepID=A0A238Z3L4_9BACT|nr:CvpA family protein [Humidesulfovibrio mexicanus]SNR77463.1 membrane protein required for colicin V production [Humidesulfovibrio mexicanus]